MWAPPPPSSPPPPGELRLWAPVTYLLKRTRQLGSGVLVGPAPPDARTGAPALFVATLPTATRPQQAVAAFPRAELAPAPVYARYGLTPIAVKRAELERALAAIGAGLTSSWSQARVDLRKTLVDVATARVNDHGETLFAGDVRPAALAPLDAATVLQIADSFASIAQVELAGSVA